MTQIKICGLTNLADVEVAVEAGANLLGFIFYPPSPRYVEPETVQQIIATLRSRHPQTPRLVGVFVNAPAEQVQQTLNDCQLDMAQLHGDESPQFVARFAPRSYKALRPQSLSEAQTEAARYVPHGHIAQCETMPAPRAPDLLVDAYHPHLYGGTGHGTDWGMAATLAQQYALLLAGSLTPDNVAAAIQQVQPWGVDVSSGVEAAKGRKDHAKLRAFVAAVRGVSTP